MHVGGLLERGFMNDTREDWPAGRSWTVMHDTLEAEVSANPTGNSGERMALQSCLKLRQGEGLVTPH